MGVPSFTRWLLQRYTGCIERCISWSERKGSHVRVNFVRKDQINETRSSDHPVETRLIDTDHELYDISVEQSRLEFDNLYVDMCVIHELSLYNLS